MIAIVRKAGGRMRLDKIKELYKEITGSDLTLKNVSVYQLRNKSRFMIQFLCLKIDFGFNFYA